jgi:hypothetical protein
MNQAAQVSGRTVAWWGLLFPSNSPDITHFAVAQAPQSFLDPFKDVSGSYRYRTAIIGVSEKGIATGYVAGADQIFKPDQPLLRAQFAKMVCEAFHVPVSEGMTTGFTDLGSDDPNSFYPREYVAALSARGIVQGVTATTFNPYGALSRAQAVSILIRALDVFHPGLVTSEQGQAPRAVNWEPPHLTDLRRAYANDLLSSLIDYQKPWDALVPCSRGEAAQMLWNALLLVDQEGR